ncbi:UDP-sugar pyrophosphorylase [Platanthera guangdongensis]|uniref:UTP-monosaccharide-1-phosphate uridylyltransferase n=1 Tax=Platanthera guangdongensis TaxID=2320717 RepID=A0ABR2LQS4_9ASPA
MTSYDTHIPTLKLLESNYFFGMKPDQVILIKQEKVACLDDNDARIALDPNDKYMIQNKPHGHSDVHSLLYNSGLLNKWFVTSFSITCNTLQVSCVTSNDKAWSCFWGPSCAS